MNKEEKKPADAEQLVSRMAEIRTDLDRDTEKLYDGARKLSDWKGYVRSYPWVAVGAAAAVGFLLVPKKKQPAMKPDTAAFEELLKSKKLVVEPAAKRAGLAAGLTGIGLKILGQVAARQAMQFAQEMWSDHQHEDDYVNAGDPLPDPRRGKPR